MEGRQSAPTSYIFASYSIVATAEVAGTEPLTLNVRNPAVPANSGKGASMRDASMGRVMFGW